MKPKRPLIASTLGVFLAAGLVALSNGMASQQGVASGALESSVVAIEPTPGRPIVPIAVPPDVELNTAKAEAATQPPGPEPEVEQEAMPVIQKTVTAKTTQAFAAEPEVLAPAAAAPPELVLPEPDLGSQENLDEKVNPPDVPLIAAVPTIETELLAPEVSGLVPQRSALDASPQTSALIVPIEIPPEVRVERGNSLWKLSRDYYGRGDNFRIIFDANRDKLESPHRIYPGQVLKLPPKAGL